MVLFGDRTVKDFVRRRRWIRTRVPVDAEAAVVHVEGTSPLGGRLGTEFGLVCGQSPPRLHEALSFPHSGALVSLHSHPSLCCQAEEQGSLTIYRRCCTIFCEGPVVVDHGDDAVPVKLCEA